MAEAEERAEEWLTAGGINVMELEKQVNGNHNHGTNGNGTDRMKRYQGLLSRKHIETDMAARLIDAAFTLGVEAGRSGRKSSVAQVLARQQKINKAA